MNSSTNPQEEILNFALKILVKTTASNGMDLDLLKRECSIAIFQDHESNLSTELKFEAVRILEKLILSNKNIERLKTSLNPTGSHHKFDNFEITENEGIGIHINTDDPNGNLTLSNFRISKNKGNGFVYNGGTKPKTNIELILDAVKDKLPKEIKLEDVAPLIKDVLDSKSPDEAKQKIDASSLKERFKDPAVWISITQLIWDMGIQVIGQ